MAHPGSPATSRAFFISGRPPRVRQPGGPARAPIRLLAAKNACFRSPSAGEARESRRRPSLLLRVRRSSCWSWSDQHTACRSRVTTVDRPAHEEGVLALSAASPHAAHSHMKQHRAPPPRGAPNGPACPSATTRALRRLWGSEPPGGGHAHCQSVRDLHPRQQAPARAGVALQNCVMNSQFTGNTQVPCSSFGG